MSCPHCGSESRKGAQFCGDCGRSLERDASCSGCGRENPAGQRFCDGCGARLRSEPHPDDPPRRSPHDYTPRHLADRILQSRSALEGERKQVTVLFADVKGSMELAEQTGPEEWHAILDRFFGILADGVHRFEGTVNQYTGDGIMALFGAPLAHEDHAQRACFAALSLQGELRRYADTLRVERGLSFGVRIGLNSGEVVVGKIGDDLRMDYTAQGHAVGLAQRMEQLAESGRVYLTQHTARRVEGFFQLRSLGESAVAGVSGPLCVFELQGAGPLRTRLDLARTRGLSRFVGRADETALLDTALERALAGDGGVVAVVADAGVGKSRLCYQFAESCRARGLALLEAHCPAHGATIPFLPVLELLRASFGIEDGERDRTAREKVAGRLLLLDREFEQTLPLVFDFLGIPDPDHPAPARDPDLQQHQLLTFVERLFRNSAAREPTVVVIDDLHWIDDASHAFVVRLAEAAIGNRMLLLLNFRPEYERDGRGEWLQAPGSQTLPLVPLGPEAITELLRDRLGDHPSTAALPERIRARTGGNPFFAEEVVQSLVESGQLAGTLGAYRLAAPLAEIDVPDSVQSVLAARIDRLSEREKQLLQTAAVIGREFAEPLLEAVAALPPAALGEALAALVEAELLVERALYPVAEYAFRHPLTHEVALHSQLQQRQRGVHAAVARALENARPDADADRLDEQAALLAHHFEQAGEAVAAARWHGRAARWAAGGDHSEALRHWRAVRRLIAALEPTEELEQLALDAAYGTLYFALYALESGPEFEQAFADGVALAERRGDQRALALLHTNRTGVRWNAGDTDLAAHTAAARAAARTVGDPALMVAVESRLIFWESRDEKVDAMLARLDAIIAAGPADPRIGLEFFGQSPLSRLHTYRGYLLHSASRLAEARAALEHGLRLAGDVDVIGGRLAAGLGLGQLALTRGDFSSALEWGHRNLERAQASGSPYWLRAAHAYLAAAQAEVGEWEATLQSIERSPASVPTPGKAPSTFPIRAQALYELGERRAGLDLAAQAARDMTWGIGFTNYNALLVHVRLRLRSLGADAAEHATRLLDQLESYAVERGRCMLLPFIAIERAALARVCGDDATDRARLHEAERLFREMGANVRAERIARELAS